MLQRPQTEANYRSHHKAVTDLRVESLSEFSAAIPVRMTEAELQLKRSSTEVSSGKYKAASTQGR
jgi:hypothetical protein